MGRGGKDMTDLRAGSGSDKFMLRMPEGMRKSIKISAINNNRSMNAEINVALSMYLGVADKAADKGWSSAVQRVLLGGKT
jgi:hypothetical protein